MRRIFFSLFILFTTTAIAAKDRCFGLVPEEVVAATAKAFPAYRMPKSTDNLAEDVEYNLSQRGSGCLGVARGDFDGDGKRDFLVGLSSRTVSDGGLIVAALRRESGWAIERLSDWPTGRHRLFVEQGKPGKYERAEALDGPTKEPGEVEALKCPQNAAIFGATEANAVAYCRRSGKWQHVWISD